MKISVIIPVFNTEKFLSECLDSVLKQTYTDFEIICVNDGSPDNSAEILSDYEKKYPQKIKVLTKENGGLSSARNFGIKHASGEYLSFIDSDDTVLPDFLEKMIECAEKNDLDIVTCNFFYKYESGKTVFAPVSKSLTENLQKDFVISGPMACVRLIKKELLINSGFKESTLYEDLERIPALIVQTQKVGKVGEALYNYYQRSGSIMNKPIFDKKLYDIFSVLDSLKKRFTDAGKFDQYSDEIEFLYIEHLLRSAAMRFSEFDNGKTLFGLINSAMKTNFPQWKKNPYLKKSGFKFKILVFLTSINAVKFVKILKKINK